MSNYTKENLIAVPPTSVPVGTLAIKVGDVIFTPGNIKIGQSMEFYKCASVDTVNKTWTGYKAVLKNGFYTITDEQKTLEYSSFTPEVGKVYPEEMTGIFMPFKDPSLVPVINDQNTVLLIYPGASEGRVENIGMGKDACTGDFTCDMTVQDNRIKSGGRLTLPAGYLPATALGTEAEWTFDVCFSLDMTAEFPDTYEKYVWTVNNNQNCITRMYSKDTGEIILEVSSYRFNLSPSLVDFPVTPRWITLEHWNDNGTMKITLYLNGQVMGTAEASWWTSDLVSNGVAFPGVQSRGDWFRGDYAMISVRTAADHRGQSFEIKNNPYS